MSENKVWRWGIVGPGRIALRFAEALSSLEEAEITAVYSHDAHRAKKFASHFRIPKHFGTYEALTAESPVDICYLANLNTQHFATAKMILNAGKHLLCEKPICLNRAEAEELYALAKSKGLFLAEAMWTSFHPVTLKVFGRIEEGVIGDVKEIELNFGFRGSQAPTAREHALNLGGGALLDVGVYCLAYIEHCFPGQPERFTISADQTAEGVDETSRVTLEYSGGRRASFTASTVKQLDNTARIIGDKGMIVVPEFYHPAGAKRFSLDNPPRLLQSVTNKDEVNGFEFEAREVMRCLDRGLTECPLHPMERALDTLELMDSLRREIGLVYPGENL